MLTYSMFSGLPVSVQGLSNMPPLSVTKSENEWSNTFYLFSPKIQISLMDL